MSPKHRHFSDCSAYGYRTPLGLTPFLAVPHGEEWAFQLPPARETADVEALITALRERQATGGQAGGALSPMLTLSPDAARQMRIEARLAAQRRLMPEREADWNPWCQTRRVRHQGFQGFRGGRDLGVVVRKLWFRTT